MFRLTLAMLVLTTALGGCSDSNDDDRDPPEPPPPAAPPENTEDFAVTLSAGEVAGGGAETGSASADVTVNLDDGAVTGTVTFTGVEPDAVRLARGFAGEAGAPLIELEADSATEWSFPGNAVLSTDELEALAAAGLYLEATTADLPEGALRGQIVPDGVEVRFVRLSGTQEVPPLETQATAMAALTFDGNGGLVLHVNTEGLDDAAESHIHDGVAGTNGPIVIGLVQDPDDVSHWSLEDFVLDEAQQPALDAGRLYVNVHTPEHPGGEVRGQIDRDGVEIFFTTLTGDDVVPPVTSEASGVAAATLIAADRTLALHVNLLDLDDAETVDVRQAPVMQNGPPVLVLEQDPNELSHWSLDAVTLTDAQHEALRNQGLYLNVATPDFPDGEVRGQLVPEMSAPGSGEAFVVTAVSPDDGATVDALPAAVTATFNRDPLAASAGAEQVNVEASGGDGSFDDGNETAVGVLGVTVAGAELTADLDTNAATDDVYRITLDGSSGNPLTDAEGVVLDGDADGTPGGDFVSTYTVSSGASAPTLSQLQADIFTPTCARSGCHAGSSPAQGMNLSAGQTFANTVGVPSTEVPELNRVEPGNPDDSYLVQKVEGTAAVGGRMPLGEPPLPNAQIQAIRDWISAGAEDN